MQVRACWYLQAMTELELDYAMVAEFAQVQNNRLTMVGASFTQLFTAQFPVNLSFSVAGRVRVPDEMPGFNFDITARLPNIPGEEAFEMQINGHYFTDPNVHRYAGKHGMLFAVGMNIPAFSPGIAEIFIDLQGKRVRRLAFDILKAE